MPQETVVLNDVLEQRTRPSGKVRFTVAVKSEPLIHNFDAKRLGKGPALAIVAHLRERMLGIGQAARPATLLARRVAAKAVSAGKSWATRRYSGGKTGAMPPNQSDRMFNDSGRFAKTLTANAREDAWTINVAANRLDPTTADGVDGVQTIFARLVELVPEFGNSALLATSIPVRRAIEDSRKLLIQKLGVQDRKASLAVIKAAIEVVSKAFEVGEALAG